MKRVSVVFVLSMAIAALANAQATRTWVSGVGDDANPCSRTAPCKTFAGAISKTAAGGIINCLDPGGFGAVTITKSITIDCIGTYGSVLASGTQGIVINALSTDNIVLRGLDINGANGGTNGVNEIQAKNVSILNCRIANFQFGVKATNTVNSVGLTIAGSQIINNSSWGAQIGPNGIAAVLNMSDTLVNNNGQGIDVAGPASAVISNSHIERNGTAGLQVEQTAGTATVESSSISGNAIGIQAGLAANTPTIRLSRCVIVGNTTNGIANNSTVIGFSNNAIAANGGTNAVGSSVAQQ